MSDGFYIGIDPGKSGGIAMVSGAAIRTAKMPEVSAEFWQIIKDLEPTAVIVEKVNAGPKMGSSAAFKFGQNVGMISAFCYAAGHRVVYVSPQRWQKEFSLIVTGRGLGQNDTAKKNRNKQKACELFPSVKITHAVADALLLAEYGRRMKL